MSVCPASNTINPQYLVMPDRVIVPEPTTRAVVPNPKPFDGLPGVVPFARMLRAENLADPYRVTIPREHDTFEPTPRASSPTSSSVHLLPKLGEVLPVAPFALASIKVVKTRQVELPATGRVLDIYL